ncbi:MAG TPA: sulfite exporter TauE/SafE family protein, partial [Burkholderiales bacterium]|nr:sulfite exporter TauE/SafE family protein [Burkholderiales bacterium]
MPSPDVLIFAPLIVLIAYLIFGISGFGSTLIAVPLLAHLMPLKFVIPVVVVLDCVSAISMGLKLRADVWKSEFVPMLPFLLV